MEETNRCIKHYSEEERRAALEKLAENEGNVAKTARDTRLRAQTIRRWRDEDKHGKRAVKRKGGKLDSAKDLRKFSDDSWEIIHKANELVKDEVEGMQAKEAATIAAGYFDRQAKAEERLTGDGGPTEEYAAEWSGEGK